MASFKNLFQIFFAIVALFALISNASPVPSEVVEDSAESDREARQFGLANANAFASASSTGLGGYPGFGIGSANAVASANAIGTGIGYPYGK